ncbi:acyl-CoA desaturase-like [Centropristis striata]|uniref:acyl-CoA desaturase-like n=1 Tax=Centropristis striata TaxID=184440 RepID=UPI0027E115C6|nr:acyl-CoA desaturase-like [Centropristis striata]
MTQTLTYHASKQRNGNATTEISDVQDFNHNCKEKEGPRAPVVVVWRNVVLMSLLHSGALYGLTLIPSASVYTLAFTAGCYFFGNLGVTAGSHRLWSHRSYKASFPLRVFLAFCQTLALQNDIYDWTRDHRVHHKHSETNADPHNATRGFFFSHIGWLLSRKHPDVIQKGQKLDLSDLKADKVVMFQRRYYKLLVLSVCFLMPTLVPWYFWGESLAVAYFVPGLLRYVLGLHATWLVNSAAHMWGEKPYDQTISPSENPLVSLAAIGEGFHNYHHTFPFDYSASELDYWLNPTTAFIDLMCLLGLAKDRKRVSKDMIKARMQRTGGSKSSWVTQAANCN